LNGLGEVFRGFVVAGRVGPEVREPIEEAFEEVGMVTRRTGAPAHCGGWALASTSARMFVVRPPRERPMKRKSIFFFQVLATRAGKDDHSLIIGIMPSSCPDETGSDNNSELRAGPTLHSKIGEPSGRLGLS
jgi:hypothetical protein